eukprot:scaffold8192_cov183-Skeletonema_dohrnii-CCMP3373.AAC.4
MERWSCWHFTAAHYHPTSTKAKNPSSQTEKMCLETKFEATKLLLRKDGLVGTSIAAHYHPTSTKAKYPSSQTEKMCLEIKFEASKLLLSLFRPISRLAPHDLACRWRRELVGTSTAAHYHPTSTKAKHPSSQTEKMCLET